MNGFILLSLPILAFPSLSTLLVIYILFSSLTHILVSLLMVQFIMNVEWD